MGRTGVRHRGLPMAAYGEVPMAAVNLGAELSHLGTFGGRGEFSGLVVERLDLSLRR
jgi:hypothetical protein